MADAGIVLLGRRYRVERNFARPSEPFGFISQVAAGPNGEAYVLQRRDPPVVVIGPSGEQIGAFGQGRILDGHGISVDDKGRVWVVDRDSHEIICFSPEGEELMTIGARDNPGLDEPFNHPTKAMSASDGAVYVSDGYGNHHMHKFSSEGDHLLTWGGAGKGPGQFSTPHAVAETADGRILVTDRENGRVQVFDADGNFLDQWTGFYNPMDVLVTDQDQVIVSDQVPRLYLLTSSGEVIGRCRGSINGAHGIAAAPDGTLYLAELPPANLTRLCPI